FAPAATLFQPFQIAERAEQLLRLAPRHRLLHAGRGRRLRLRRLRLAAGRRWLAGLGGPLAGLRVLRPRRALVVGLRLVGLRCVGLGALVLLALEPLVVPARVGVVGRAFERAPQLGERLVHVAAPAEQRAEVVAAHRAGGIGAPREVREL